MTDSVYERASYRSFSSFQGIYQPSAEVKCRLQKLFENGFYLSTVDIFALNNSNEIDSTFLTFFP